MNGDEVRKHVGRRSHILVRKRSYVRGIAHHIHRPTMQLVHRGHGFMDVIRSIIGFLKPIVTNKAVQSGAKDIVTSGINIGKNTKNIVDSIRNKKVSKADVGQFANEVLRSGMTAPEILNATPLNIKTPVIDSAADISTIINRINKIRTGVSGSGAMKKRRGKGFAYA